MLDIGVIGIGSCGNQLALLAAENEFESLAVNSSEDDLIPLGNKCATLLIGESGGCGKDRNLGKALVKERYRNFLPDVIERFRNKQVIVVGGSTGGGTGSGMIPIFTDMLRSALKQLDLNVVVVNALMIPHINEALKAQSNTIECVAEIRGLELPHFIYDNGRVNDPDIINVFEKVNQAFIQDLKIFRGDVCEPSNINMDDRDRLTLIATRGLITVSKVGGIKENNLDKQSVTDIIIQSIKESYNVDIERDKVVRRMGFIFTLPKPLIGKIDRSYAGVKEYAGVAAGGEFEHINNLEVEQGSVVTILAGLSYPATRMEEIADKIEELKEAATRVGKDNSAELKNAVSWLNDDDSSLLGTSTRTKPTNNKKQVELKFDDDMFSKY